MIQVKRVYEHPEKSDGYRILVDRLWPRGVSKERASIDVWLKDIAPSDALRKWFSHKDEKWGEFKKKYFSELKEKRDLIDGIKRRKKVTLVYAAKNTAHNHAVALKEFIDGHT